MLDGREYQLGTTDFTLIAPETGATYSVQSHRDLKYKTSAPKEAVRDHQGRIVGWVLKDQDNSGASVRVLQSEWKTIKAWVKQQYPTKGIGQVRLNAVVTYGDSISTDDLMTDEIKGLMFQEEARAAGADQKELEIELPLFVFGVKPHGGEFIQYRAA